MKFSFFSPKASKAEMEREAQQELEAAVSRAQPPTDAQRTWVIPQQEIPDWAKPAPRRRSTAQRRLVRPLIPPPAPAEDDFDDLPFEDDTPLDQVPLNEVFNDAPQRRPAPRPAAPRKKAAGTTGNAAPRSARPKPTPAPPPTSAAAPRPRPAQKRTPPTRRRPPE